MLAEKIFPLIWIVAALALVVWVCFLQWLIAHVSGWSKMAFFHRAHSRPEGAEFRWRSLQCFPWLPIGGYNHCIHVIITSEGVYLEPVWIVRFAHPPLMIPWRRMGSMQRERGFFKTRYYLPIHAAGKEWKLFLPREAREKTERQVA